MRFWAPIFTAIFGVAVAGTAVATVFTSELSMGMRGPAPKSAEVRILEGGQAHRPLPNVGPKYAPGVPDRPAGMSAKARRAWDAYIEQLAPLGILRRVDGFALSRLCEDVATLQELQAGQRKYARQVRAKAKKDKRELMGSAAVELAMSPEGRRLAASINALANRIKRDELQFGLTPISSARLTDYVPTNTLPTPGADPMDDPLERALCG
jgi:phage terminase small subunit